ncbi:Transcriptional regulator [Seminavis robusta]|uniref:Transcriptional regulator n=1 Tax=Seminavis robusta TaxID=568900 RepID=A0A9N8E1G8_9STRA|nr:Transcriptional regulator [Seminavis robusta]|eukprot:Sro556_g165880.1 Transcriptional regulator (1260) ;mRNA; r:8568-12441
MDDSNGVVSENGEQKKQPLLSRSLTSDSVSPSLSASNGSILTNFRRRHRRQRPEQSPTTTNFRTSGSSAESCCSDDDDDERQRLLHECSYSVVENGSSDTDGGPSNTSLGYLSAQSGELYPSSQQLVESHPSSSLRRSSKSRNSIQFELQRTLVKAKSLRRDSSLQLAQILKDEFTVNKLQFWTLGLYGRDSEIQTLLACMGRVLEANNQNQTTNKRELVLVKGMSGCGKSRLVDDALKDAAKKRGAVYMSGKFDMNNQQNNNNEPYSAIAAACGELCGVILEQSGNEQHNNNNNNNNNQNPSFCQRVRDTLLKELAPDQVQILVRTFPILEEILGCQMAPGSTGTNTSTSSSVDSTISHHHDADDKTIDSGRSMDHPPRCQRTRKAGGEARKNRFNFAFRKFLRTVGTFFSGVVFVLDDLQWIDMASLELFEVILTDKENQTLLPIGCFRSNEVDEDHILSTTILRNLSSKNHDKEDEKRDENFESIHVTEINLGNLTLGQVDEMLVDLLSVSGTEALSLARICHKKTLGNPFFLKAFLKLLHDNSLLQFNLGLMKWHWDESEIEARTQIAGNIVDLMTRQMEELPEIVRTFFVIAACLGATICRTALLAVWNNIEDVPEDKKTSLYEILAYAMDEGFLDKVGEKSEDLRWTHDQLQSMAFSLVPPDSLSSLQSSIGEALISNLQGRDYESNIFTAVKLMNQGPKPQDADECARLARLNLQAAERAVDLSAISSAEKYALDGIRFLPSNSWVTDFEVTLQLYSTAAETSGYLGHLETMQENCDVVLAQKGCHLSQKLRVYNVLLDSFANRGRLPDAHLLCQDVLHNLGCEFVKHPLLRAIQAKLGLRKLKKSMSARTQLRLSRSKTMTDPLRIEMIGLLEKLATYSYLMADWSLYVLVVLREVEWTDRYGICETASHAFGCAGLVLSALVGDFKRGSVYGEHAIRVIEAYPSKRLESQCTMVVYTFILHWTKHSHQVLEPLIKGGYETGMASGEIEYAMYSIFAYLGTALQTGRPLESLEADCRTYCSQMRQYKRMFTLGNCGVVWQVALNLMGRSADPGILTGEAMDEENFRSSAVPFQLALLRGYAAQLYAMFGLHEKGASMSFDGGPQISNAYPGSILVPMDTYYRGLSLFVMARRTKKRRYLKHAKKSLALIKKWVRKGNPNLRHYEALLEAELAACQGKSHMACAHYKIAISLSRGYIQDTALAHERYGEYMVNSDTQEAEFRIGEAIRCYREWGAHGKVIQLRERFSDLSLA